jgi:DnaJ-class molecular chaperone
MNYYETLGVPENASANAIRSAYRRLALRYHPDVSEIASAGEFCRVQEAYETLGESSRRRAYDLSLHPRSRPVHVTVIRGGTSFLHPEPLVPPRNQFVHVSFVNLDQVFGHLIRWFEADWF